MIFTEADFDLMYGLATKMASACDDYDNNRCDQLSFASFQAIRQGASDIYNMLEDPRYKAHSDRLRFVVKQASKMRSVADTRPALSAAHYVHGYLSALIATEGQR